MLYKEYGGGGTSSDPRRDIATATPIVVVWRNLLKKYICGARDVCRFCSSLITVKFPHRGVMMIHFNLHLSSYLLNFLLLLRNNTTLEYSNQILNFPNGAIITIVGDKFSYNTCIFLFQLKQSLNFPIYKV